MRSNFFIFLSTLLCSFAPGYLSAQTTSEIWLGGTNETPGRPVTGNYITQFTADSVKTQATTLKMNFADAMEVVTDSSGQVLFYSNGCHIASADGDTLLNGAGLNPGNIADWVCPEIGYTSTKGLLALQLPENQHIYYLFHLGQRYEPELKLSYGPFYYTVIDMSLNNGKGAVISKNNVLLDGKLEPFSAVRHGNGRDWWFVVPEYGTNRYFKILFDKTGIAAVNEQTAGPTLACKRTGATAFSLNGMKFGRSQSCKAVVFDFDRCSGLFSNPVDLPLPANATGVYGIAFTPEANKVLITNQLAILEADLNSTAPVLDTLVSTGPLLGYSLGHMQYDQFGRLIISNDAREKFNHVIRDYDGNAANFNFHLNNLAFGKFNVRTLPNHPDFQLYDLPGSVCDTLSYTSSAEIPLPTDFTVSPNPASDVVFVEYKNLQNGYLVVTNSLGEKVTAFRLQDEGFLQLNIQSWAKGVYFFQVSNGKGGLLCRRVIVL